tara:strand:- start:10491 stop:11843 length:1353 start_codon:yes stop_codon:yes gene_type:complete
MNTFNLSAISPIDGRYSKVTEDISKYFSEFALIRYRVYVEIEYFIALYEFKLPELKNIKKSKIKDLREIVNNFSINDAKKIKKIEDKINHDLKAVEYFIKEKFKKLGLEEYKEFVHYGLTSQDINNTAIPLMLKDCLKKTIIPSIKIIQKSINIKSKKFKNIPMVSRTHGQPATPTTFGKELKVFHERISVQLDSLIRIPNNGKFGGASGNLNAHYVSYPKINWDSFSDKFLKKIGLIRSNPTTQIEHYDNMAAIFHCLSRINTILIDFSKDIWHYVSINYLKQKVKKNEVGSSAMPHKVNPIDFENAEGNLMMANQIFQFLSEKLPVSRLQRDLTDSTVSRNIGIPISHTKIALNSLSKGLEKIEINKKEIENDLENNWSIIAEAIQTILRREKVPNPYETLKKITRGNSKIDKKLFLEFIDKLPVSNKVKKELYNISPKNYLGNSQNQ